MSSHRVVTAEDFLPRRGASVPALRRAAAVCRGCDLYERATQTVFGEGNTRHPVAMLVGEQPGNVEDETGEPFVGPAGGLLDDALATLGVERRTVYVTNAVKHFKWEAKGKLRLHKNPSAREVAACRPWLEAEIDAVRPQMIVCLGATAARSVLGPAARVGRDRGQRLAGPSGCTVVVTAHPASILRLNDTGERKLARQQFVADLRIAFAAATPGRTSTD